MKNSINELFLTNQLYLTELTGYIAAFCSTISLIPQIVKLWQDRSAKAISTTMYLIYSLGVIFWLIYGIMINSVPLIIAEIITLVLSVTIIVMKFLWE